MPGLRNPAQAPPQRTVNISFDGVQWVMVGTIVESYLECDAISEPFTTAYNTSIGLEPIRQQLWTAIPEGRVVTDCGCVGDGAPVGSFDFSSAHTPPKRSLTQPSFATMHDAYMSFRSCFRRCDSPFMFHNSCSPNISPAPSLSPAPRSVAQPCHTIFPWCHRRRVSAGGW